jgi:hypothetical protein
MIGKRNLRSLCLLGLLIAEATQGLTPDIASLTSTRLVQVIHSIVDREASCLLGFLVGRHAPACSKTMPRANESLPWEDSEADEVCLASFPTGARLVGDASGDARKTERFTFAPDGARLQAGCLAWADCAFVTGGSHSLIHSLCRLTC